MQRDIEIKMSVFLPRDTQNSPEEIGDKLVSILVQHDNFLFNTVVVKEVDEKFGSPQRKVLSGSVDFDELRKAIVDNYNATIDELRMYYQEHKKTKKLKDDIYGVYLELDRLKEGIQWLLRCNNLLPVELSRIKDAYFFAEPTKETEKEQSK
jgi:hypothetical protein